MVTEVFAGVDVGGSHIGIGFLGKENGSGVADVDLLLPALSIDIDSSTITQLDIVSIIKTNIVQVTNANPSWRMKSVGEGEEIQRVHGAY